MARRSGMGAARIGLLALACWIGGGAVARAAVVVPPFSASGELSIFAPEVARAVAAALAQAGVEVAGAGTPVTGRIEAIGEERVRLVALVAGRSAQVEGPLEEIDRLASELAARLVPLLPSGSHHPLASHPPLAAHDPRAHHGINEPSEATPTATTQNAPLPALPAAPTEAKPAPAAPPSSPAPAAPIAAPAPLPDMATPAPPPPTTPAPQPSSPPQPPRETVSPTRPAPAPPTAPAPAPSDPAYEALPPPAPRRSPAPPPRNYGSYRALGRAVLNTVRTPEGCPSWPTLAAREVLERQVMIPTTPGGCGILNLRAATTEMVRTGIGAVVMASLDNLRFETVGDGYRPVGRLHVVVVRDGQAVLVQTLDLTSHALAAPDVPTASYDLIAAGFSRLAGALGTALSDAR